MHTTRSPPVDPAPATITAVLAMHAGHICPSYELRSRRLTHSWYTVPVIKIVLFSMFIPPLWLSFLHAIAHRLRAGYVLQERFCLYPVLPSRSRTSAVTSLRYRFAQRHMPPSGVMIVFPSLVNEYSTAMALHCVTRLAIKPADSRLRRVLVSMRCDTLPSWRRNCPWR
jgi:hypothetical protein